MPNPILQPCLDIGTTQPLRFIEIKPGGTVQLRTHVCPVGYVEWMLGGDPLQEALHRTFPSVTASGESTEITLQVVGDYEMTWAAACAQDNWAAASVISVNQIEQMRQTIVRDQNTSPIIFSVGIRVRS